MTLKGIDVSKWQGDIRVDQLDSDFVICKATEGYGYVDPQCDNNYQEAVSANKLRGVYHFARPDLNPNGAIDEANWFVDNCLGYIGDAILILDWESSASWNTWWAKQWLDHVYSRTGVKPLIYMSQSVENGNDWSAVVAGDYGLWIAKYLDYEIDYNYDMSNAGNVPTTNYWPFYAMWQWTSVGRLNGYSGNLDCGIFYGDVATWHAYAGKKAEEVKPVETPVVVSEPTEPTKPVVIPVEPVKPVTEPVVKPQPKSWLLVLTEAIVKLIKVILGKE